MLSKSKSVSGGPGSISGPKKKKAPPRPPPPANSKIQTSQSFRTSSELQSQQKRATYGQTQSYSIDRPGTRGLSDLIDLATPPGSPESAKRSLDGPLKPKGPPDYMYRVGASIFYMKSQLKNSTSEKKIENPFSPPRPSAQSLLSSPVKFSAVQPNSALYPNPNPIAASSLSYNNTRATGTTVPSNTNTSYHVASAETANASSMKYKPTIIKKQNENNNNSIKVGGGNGNMNNAGGSFRSSSGSSDWSDYSQPSQSQQQPRYGNVPMPTWDEPPAQNQPKTSVVLPTIIKPPTMTKPSLLPKPNLAPANRLSTGNASTTIQHSNQSSNVDVNAAQESWAQRNYYDDPPDSDFDDDGDFNDDSVASPPMPSDPPPPPPPDLAVDEWVDSTKDAPAYHESVYDNQGAETDRAYAITLYDYIPDVDGDLPLQAGDLVYLTRKIDDAWLYGQCAGLEGMFPSTYVNVVVPLPEEVANSSDTIEEHVEQAIAEYPTANALYQFDAEAEGDLSLQVGDLVTLYGRLNDDWLYGEVNGSYGQFPAAFVSPVPSDLQMIPTGS